MAKVIIAGVDGYIGTALHEHLKNHEVFGFDNNSREENVKLVGGKSVTIKKEIPHEKIDARDYEKLKAFVDKIKPDAIVWLAEQPSAPFSQLSNKYAKETVDNNIIGTLNIIHILREHPNCHLIKLGTEGEYPDWIWDGKKIPEGKRMKVDGDWEIPTPRYFGSFYHFTKFSESYLLDYANRIWGITATDVNQGIVYGHCNGTRLDADEFFGTVVHRFCAQGVLGLPLTVFGEGGQTRGMIALQNSIEALKLLIENPPKKGELRVIHQTGKEYSVMQVAEMVDSLTNCGIKKIKNPRVEKDHNHFTFDTTTLDKLGLKKIKLEDELAGLCDVFLKNIRFIKKESVYPKKYTQWKS